MSRNAKRVLFCITISIVLSAVLLLLPGLFKKATPVAEQVFISKKEYQDVVSVDGNIIREMRTDDINVQMFISERDISKIKKGQIAEVRGDAFPDKVYTAEIVSISSVATKVTAGGASRTVVEVYGEIIGADDSLKSGFTARVTIKVGESEEKRLLPYEAVDQDENGEFVWIAADGIAQKRYIITGEELPDGIEVIAGLEPTDEIIKLPEGVSAGDEIAVEVSFGTGREPFDSYSNGGKSSENSGNSGANGGNSGENSGNSGANGGNSGTNAGGTAVVS
jgi:multidrug efflux pump subunit AcrA (membrane-fusion protein)